MHPTYAPARSLDLALRANTDGDMDLDTVSVKTAPGPSLPIVSTLSCAPLSPTPSAPRGSSPHASESRAQVSTSGMGSSLNENAHVREMRAQTLNRLQDPAQRHTHTLNGRQHGLGWYRFPRRRADDEPGISTKKQTAAALLLPQNGTEPTFKDPVPVSPSLTAPSPRHLLVSSPSLKRLCSAPVLPSEAGAGEEAGDHAHTCSVLSTPAESGIDDGGRLLATPMVWAIRARTGWGWRRIVCIYLTTPLPWTVSEWRRMVLRLCLYLCLGPLCLSWADGGGGIYMGGWWGMHFCGPAGQGCGCLCGDLLSRSTSLFSRLAQPITNQSTSSKPESRTTFSFESPSDYSTTVSLSNLIPDTSVNPPTPDTILHIYKLIIAQAADLAGATSELRVEPGDMFFAKCLQAALGILRVFLLRCSPHATLTAAFPDLLDAGMQWYLHRNSMTWQTAIFITFHWIFHWLWVHKSQKIRLLAQALTNEKQ
ncbi:hypothetical protein JB92DRAFT_2833206 [Gautieria morchelliformis]|nr:hypothetical protein JB92DRAFT_2833206 [Gautieria morchelliformis]